ncbi:MAG: hypothetical protein AB7S57_03775, partial [Acetobacteraceae bacterium]
LCDLPDFNGTGLDHRAHPDHLAQIAFDQVHDFGGHRIHGDLDLHRVTLTARTQMIGHEVALGEGLQQAGQKTGRGDGVQVKTHGHVQARVGRQLS